jgi:hypothetical protein
MKNKCYPLILILLFIVGLSNQQKITDCYPPYCSCRDAIPENLFCINFSSFKDLVFDESSSKIWKSISLVPNSQIQLNEDLELFKLKFYNDVLISIYRIESIYAYSDVFQRLRIYERNGEPKLNGKIRINFLQSTISFAPFKNANSIELLQDFVKCEYNELRNDRYIFANLNITSLEFFESTFPNTLLICPLLFFNSSIDELEFSAVQGKIRFRNVQFPAEIQQKSIKSKIMRVNLYENEFQFIEEIDTKSLFNEYLFEKVEQIWVIGSYINYIDDQTLQNLKYLRKLHLERVQSPRQQTISIFSNTKWLENLNKRFPFDFDSNSLDLVYFSRNYFNLIINDFPNILNEENVCFLMKFPINNLVIPELPFNGCKCSTFWLYRYFLRNRFFVPFLPNNVKECFEGLTEQDLNTKLQNCDLNAKCGLTTLKSTLTSTSNRQTTVVPITRTRPIYNHSSFLSIKTSILIMNLFVILKSTLKISYI